MTPPTDAAARSAPVNRAYKRVDLLLKRLPFGMACAAWGLAASLHRELPWLAGFAVFAALSAALWLSVRSGARSGFIPAGWWTRPTRHVGTLRLKAGTFLTENPYGRYFLLFLFPLVAKPADFTKSGSRPSQVRMKGVWLFPLLPSYLFGVSYSIYLKNFLWHTHIYAIKTNTLSALKKIDIFATVHQYTASCFMFVGCYVGFAVLYCHHLAAAKLLKYFRYDPKQLTSEYYIARFSGFMMYLGLACLLQIVAFAYLTNYSPRKLHFLELWIIDWSLIT